MKQEFFAIIKFLLLIPVLLFLLYGCSQQNVIPDGYTEGASIYSDYVITKNGNVNNVNEITTEYLDTEYSTLLLLSGTEGMRDIFFGGLIDQAVNASKVRIECSSLWSPDRRKYIKTFSLFGHTYYFVDFNILSYNSPTDANIYVRLLDNNENVLSLKQYTIKIAAATAKDWGIRVYQQESYDWLDIAKDDLIDSFSEMGVYFGNNNINIVNVNSSLPDQVVNYNQSAISANEDELLQYVFQTIYPGIINVTAGMDQFWSDYPNTGLLFFIKDYNPIGSTPNDLSGTTYSQYYDNGVAKKAPISVIFAEKQTNINQPWKNRYISYNVIHELGHLWCYNFIDATHSFWHNSDYKDRCSMVYDLDFINGNPTPFDNNKTENVINFRKFCFGHIQRGSNVSWQLRQYTPFGEGNTSPDKIILASNTNTANSLNDNLKIELVCDKTEFIQGESIEILIKITNNKPDTITVIPKYYLDDLNSDSTFTHNGGGICILPPYGTCYYMLDPADWLLFFGRMDFTTTSLVPGNYIFFSSAEYNNQKYLSNKINIKIHPVPDSLVQAFNDLKQYPHEMQTIEKAKENLEKYESTFYEKKFYSRLLFSINYQNAVKNKADFGNYRDEALSLYKEFIMKFPDSSISSGLFRIIMYNYADNHALVVEILTYLNINQPDCKLLEVLRNQPEDLYKPVKHFLY